MAEKRARRAELRAGAPKKQRVPFEPAGAKRFTRKLEGVHRFIITSAQNATPVHAEFFATLERYAEHTGAELVVIPLRYKNPTSIWSAKQDSDEWWATEVTPYLHNTRKKLNDNLILCADVKTQPTASSPLSGFEALTGAESCIIGHPKMQLVPVPAPTGKMAKILTTTGACTKRNYTDTKAGKLGAFHHYLGAIVVEIENAKRFHLRQVNADRATGEFIDLDTLYTVDGARPAPPAAALIMGDRHARFTCPKVDAATFGPGGIVDVLNPAELVWHDTLDGYAVNPHHAGNPFIAQAKAAARFGDPKEEVEHAVRTVVERTKGRRSTIVASNHDDFLSRWIRNTDWRTCSAKEFYLETATAVLRSSRMTPQGAEYLDPFAYWVNRLKGKAPVKCLSAKQSHKIRGIECGYHGHAGPNGARATMKNMARIGAKTVDAHSHTPGIEEGHYKVGTSTPLSLEYTIGPSSWLNAHCGVYDNGARVVLIIVDGAWRVPFSTPKSPRRM